MTRGVGGQSPANIQKYLGGIHYPASKNDLLDCAQQNDAPKQVIEAITQFDADRFGGPQDVMKAYGDLH